MSQSIGRSYTFCAAHRIMGHEGKCKNLHGHTYTAEIYLYSSEGLDQLDRVLDYSVIDEVVGNWIKENWDHAAIMAGNDPLARAAEEEGCKVYILHGYQPTAEVLAMILLKNVKIFLDARVPKERGITAYKVVIRESPTSYAEAL